MFQWLSRQFERRASESSSPSNPAPWLFELFGAVPTAAGKSVTPQSALKCTPVACAVRAIAEPIGQLPVIVYRRTGDGGKERDTEHPAHRLLHDEANPWTSAAEFRTQVTVDALLHGTALPIVNRVDGGRPAELIRVRPGAVTVRADDRTSEPIYEMSGPAGRQQVRREDVLHVRCSLSHDGLNGESPITLAREAIAAALIMEEHCSRLFSGGARPSGVLAPKGDLGEAAIASIRKILDTQHVGDGKSGKTLLLPKAFEFLQLALTSADAQFLELRKFCIDEIARAFRVPPHLLYEMGRATWSNVEHLGAAFLTYSLIPWIKAWEGAINRTLFTPEERRTHFAEFLVDDLLRADIAARADAYGKLIAARVLNPNECRALENRPPYDGGEKFENPNVATARGGSDE